MDTSYSYQDSLHLLNDSEWSKLSVQNRAAVMQSIENEAARREGRTPCNVSLFSEAPKNGSISAGRYNPANNGIELNTYHLSGNTAPCLNTVMHEGRHSYQDKAVKGEIYHHNQGELKAWRDNMKQGNYIDPEKNRRAYYRQPIEADAREYADITSRQIQAEQKIQNSNKGIASFRAKASNSQSAAPSENKGIQSYKNRIAGTEKNNVSNIQGTSNSKNNSQSSGSSQRR